MPIRWQKTARGVYVSDPARWRLEEYDGVWFIHDAHSARPEIPLSWRPTLKACKRFVDDEITIEVLANG